MTGAPDARSDHGVVHLGGVENQQDHCHHRDQETGEENGKTRIVSEAHWVTGSAPYQSCDQQDWQYHAAGDQPPSESARPVVVHQQQGRME